MFFLAIVLCIILIGFFLACCAGGITLFIMGINAIKCSTYLDDVFFGIVFMLLAFLVFLLSLLFLAPFFV